MKKLIRLSCSVCKRTTNKLVDNFRFTTDKCTITLQCQGKLFPIEYRSDGEITAAPEVGVTDWYPRGVQQIESSAAQEPVLIDTSTGELQQLLLAVKATANPPPGSTATVTLQVKDETPREFRSFIFRRSSEFSTISGVEDGVSKKVLKFKTWGTGELEEVSVYLDGKKLQQGTEPNDYQIDDGTESSPAAPNTIQFNSTVQPNGTSQVEVIVAKMRPVETTSLTFNRNEDNESRLALGAWENVSHISRFDGTQTSTYYLFTFDVSQNTVLRKDSILFPVSTVTVSGSTDKQLSECFFMLARKPYSKVDRYPDVSIFLSDLDGDRDYLRYHTIDEVLALRAVETAVQVNFPPSKLHKFNPEPTLKAPVVGNQEQLVVDGKLVVGPDT